MTHNAAMALLDSDSSVHYLTDTITAIFEVYDSYLKGTSSANPCKYIYADFTFAPVSIGFIFQKNPGDDSLKQKFDLVIDQLTQAGLISRALAPFDESIDLVSLCKGKLIEYYFSNHG